jgi:itaconate CoA-transferase
MPFCSFLMAEMGADVLKIERMGTGDVVRGWDTVVRGLSSGYVATNADKRDIALNLSLPEGREIVRKLAAGGDVFLENFAPGVASKLGLGYEDLKATNKEIIYCSLSGYGQAGPYHDIKAYDLLVQGESGILLSNGYPDLPAKVGLPVTDLIGGATAAIGIMAALFRRERTGEGEYLDVSLLDSAVSWLSYFPHYFWHADTEPPRSGMRHQYLCPYGPFRASDSEYVNVAVASPEHWQRFCSVLGRPDWIADPRFATASERSAHRTELDRLVEQVILTRSSETWMQLMADAGLPFGHVRSVAEVLSHPQLLYRRLFVEADSPVGPIQLVRSPLANPDKRRRVPKLGEHTAGILNELGYTPGQVSGLREKGVIQEG